MTEGLFGISTQYQTSSIVLIPVPWEVTTSYGGGTSKGPAAILQASEQLDLFEDGVGQAADCGIHLLKENSELRELGNNLKGKAPTAINEGCNFMVQTIQTQAEQALNDEKIVGLIGGDHSTSLGLVNAVLAKNGGDFSILHLDAHLDLRQAYQDYEHSHASIMYNIMTSDPRPAKLVQVGIRDYCEEEFLFANKDPDIHTFYDQNLASRNLAGESWDQICQEIISHLGKKVYISCDIDGLSPDLCPNTGTPVPGGLSFQKWNHLLNTLLQSGRKVIAFDLVEVAPSPDGKNEWDANVGARVLYKLCSVTLQSQGLISKGQ